MYGWANSYFDESNKLIGNYEIGTYVGTGVAGNKVTTKGKPAWIMIKRLDAAYGWYIHDNLRTAFDASLVANTSAIEASANWIDASVDGFIVQDTNFEHNASGGQYLYMVVYDNDSGSGKSKYPRATDTSNIQVNNAIIPFANGVDSSGTKVSTISKNESITGLTYTAGNNYVYALENGTYGVKPYRPRYLRSDLVAEKAGDNPDYFDVLSNTWYSTNVAISIGDTITLNAPITARNYLDTIAYADASGQLTYVEELPKVEYKHSMKLNKLSVTEGFELNGMRAYACRAWVNFNGIGTVAIRGSGNVSSITDNGVGNYAVNFTTAMPDANFVGNVTCPAVSTTDRAWVEGQVVSTSAFRAGYYQLGGGVDNGNLYVSIFR
jgi:hypothetical protein